jgi:hypothetical protein
MGERASEENPESFELALLDRRRVDACHNAASVSCDDRGIRGSVRVEALYTGTPARLARVIAG